MKIWMTIALLAGLFGPAMAQDTLTKADREQDAELTRQEKDDALRMAYRLNGGRMNGPMVDLTDPKTIERYNKMVAPDEMPLVYPPPAAVKTVQVKPDPAPVVERADICRRHGMRRVEINGGRSWRCRRR